MSPSLIRRLCRPGAALAAALCALATLPALARANAVTSDNWSGYAVHRTGVSFRRVAGSWIQPAGSCVAGSSSAYSAFWVGLGGYSTDSDALEQIGTELDCSAAGVTKISAWYELVPKASRRISTMTVAAGDRISASVSVSGSRVTLTLADATRGEAFTRTITDATTDVSSAEWITEAPSECSGSDSASCTTLPLADFGTVDFSDARARTTTGTAASIVSSDWTTTALTLRSDGASGRFVSDTATSTATPALLDATGAAFTVAYAGTTTTTPATPVTGTSPTWPGGPGAPGTVTGARRR